MLKVTEPPTYRDKEILKEIASDHLTPSLPTTVRMPFPCRRLPISPKRAAAAAARTKSPAKSELAHTNFEFGPPSAGAGGVAVSHVNKIS